MSKCVNILDSMQLQQIKGMRGCGGGLPKELTLYE
jgi:hypothetical protein